MNYFTASIVARIFNGFVSLFLIIILSCISTDWPGWFQTWGTPRPTRPVEDIAYAVARWYAVGGTLQNYYMWHGGTTFGRWVGGPWIITSYDYNVALDGMFIEF